jgi:hypothetical protein
MRALHLSALDKWGQSKICFDTGDKWKVVGAIFTLTPFIGQFSVFKEVHAW